MNVINVNSAYAQANFEFKNSSQLAGQLSERLGGMQSLLNPAGDAELQSMASQIDPTQLINGYAISTFAFSSDTIKVQGSLSDIFGSSWENAQDSRIRGLLKSVNAFELGYTGKALHEIDKAQAMSLVSDDGFFGVENTANRIADFVLGFAGDDEKLLKQGREGMLRGFKQAGAIWGEQLPEISQKTISMATQKVDEKLSSLGISVLDKMA